MFNSFHFQTECCPNSVILNFVPPFMPFRRSVVFKVLIMFHVPPFYRSALNFVHLRRILSFKIVQPLKVLWFSLLCQRSNFVLPLPLPFLPGDISRISGRDPLLVWESCDARRPTSQKIPEDSRCSGFSRVFYFVCVIYFRFASCHHAIMSYLFCFST